MKCRSPESVNNNGILQYSNVYAESLLRNHVVDSDLNAVLEAFSFTTGEQLLPFKNFLRPKFQQLWASASSRKLNDELVVKDSDIFPYAPADHVIIVQNSQKEISVFFSYRDVVALDGSLGVYLHICLIDQKYQGQGIVKKLLGL